MVAETDTLAVIPKPSFRIRRHWPVTIGLDGEALAQCQERANRMGITYIGGAVRGPSGQEAAVHFLVDSGATYSLLPNSVWQEVGLTPKRKLEFTLADGTAVTRRVSECYIILPQGEGHSPVVLGESGDDEALLGIVTLEILGLVFNPFSRTLQPMRMLLA